MGRGQIISGGKDGKYNVRLLFSRENIALNLTALNARIVILEARIAGMPAGSDRDLVTLQKNALVKRVGYLAHMPEDETIEAWCGDLTEDLSGEVGTIEVPGERGAVNIRPGYEGAAAYDQGRDGQLQPAIASRSAATTFYNLAMLPGWQKWMPTFRYGTITSIDTGNDKCNVILETAKSSQQKLGVNHESTLIGVPIEYMTCNSAAFVVGDEVIVQFASIKTQAEDNWETAKVIGFKDNPRGCGFQFKLVRGDDTHITELSGLLSYIDLYDSAGVKKSITAPVYCPVPAEGEDTDGYWAFSLVSPVEDSDPNGYWIRYKCEDGIETQYPYRYKNSTKGQEADLLSTGNYEDVIPYWVVTSYELPTPTEKEFVCASTVDLGPDGVMRTPLPQPKLWIGDGVTFSLGRTIKSSVPYQLTFRAVPWNVAGIYWGLRAHNCSYFIVAPGAASSPCEDYVCGYITNAKNSGMLKLTYPDSSQAYLSIYESVPEDKIINSAGSIIGSNHCFNIEDASIREGWLPAYGNPEDPSYGPELVYLGTRFVRNDITVTASYDY